MEEVKTVPMDESLEVIIKSLIEQQDFESAIDFLSSIDLEYVPSERTMKLVIFEVLMKCNDARVLAEAERYLWMLLEVFPPSDDSGHKFYYNALMGTSGRPHIRNSELWDIFCHIINSCLIHFRVYTHKNIENCSSIVKFPGCILLLDYYIGVISKNYDYFADQRVMYADAGKCLLVNIFWPTSEIGVINSNCIQLLKWINDTYKTPAAHQKNRLSNQLHNVLNMIVKFIIQQKHGLGDKIAFNSHPLHEMVSNIINNCKDVFANWKNIKLFVTSSSPKYFQMKLCEFKIFEMLYSHYDASLNPLSLKKIILHYMFCFDPKTKKMRSFGKGTGLKDLKLKIKVASKNPSRGNSKLHKLVKENKFADLLECIKETPDDINSKNLAGNTPLHEACLEMNFMCVKVLLHDTGHGSIPAVDIHGANTNGHTALHLAVLKNDVTCARELLSVGGPQLMSIRDPKGRTAKCFAESDGMKKLLDEYAPVEEEEEISSEIQNYGPPNLKTFNEYTSYLYSLNILLSYYTDHFHLTDWLKSGKKSPIGCHKEKKCFHGLPTERVACSEDVMLLEKMGSLIENYIELVKQRAEELQIKGIELELIPLKLFVASLCIPDCLKSK